MREMATVHMSEAELARDLHAVLAKVQQGVEIVIEQDHQPVAVLKPSASTRPGRKLSECIALAKAYEAKLCYGPIPDEDFAEDVQAGIDSHRDSFEPPAWDLSSTPACSSRRR
jgi:antitoxin (DNA-binding transcriptional repressor) of toxin-antitoxin stability system